MPINGHYIDGIDKLSLVHNGANQTPVLVVIHYSVTNTVAEAVKVLNARKLSYHILIEKNGRAFQTRPFTKTALHPGLSNWKPTSDLRLGSSISRNSVGICLMNKGYAADQGSPKGAGKLIYNPDDASMQTWEAYPKAQIDRCRAIVGELLDAYPVVDVVGHHDIAIMGKFDPGPLFDLEELKELVKQKKSLGFSTKVKTGGGKLKLRQEPRSSGKVLGELSAGTPLHIRAVAYGNRAACIQPSPPNKARYLTRWASVDLHGADRHDGFVDMAGLTSTPLEAGLAKFL